MQGDLAAYGIGAFLLSLNNPMLLLLMVMLIAGVFGGVINFYITKADDANDSNLARSLVAGTGASFLVPLFLNMIASTLVDATKTDPYKLLVFAGFCLVAAISSGSFIRTISDRILTEAKAARKAAEEAKLEVEQAKDEIQEVQATIDPIVEKGTEPEPDAERRDSLLSANAHSTPADRILEAIAINKYAYRTLRGISRETALEEDQVMAHLAELVERGLVGEKLGKKGNTLWFATEQGLQVLRN